jgi:hypothetical protein
VCALITPSVKLAPSGGTGAGSLGATTVDRKAEQSFGSHGFGGCLVHRTNVLNVHNATFPNMLSAFRYAAARFLLWLLARANRLKSFRGSRLLRISVEQKVSPIRDLKADLP